MSYWRDQCGALGVRVDEISNETFPASRGSSVWPAARHVGRSVCPLTLSIAMTLTIPGLAQAEPDQAPNSLAALVADVAEANQRLQDVGAAGSGRAGERQQGDRRGLRTRGDAAAAAQQQVDASQQAVKDANAAIAAAQKRFDTFAAATYVNGPSASLVMARTPDEIIATRDCRADAGAEFASR